MMQEPQSWLDRYGGLVITVGAIVAGAGVVTRAAWPLIAAGYRKLSVAAAPKVYKQIRETAHQTHEIAKAMPVMTRAIEDCTAAVRAVAVKVERLDDRADEQSKKYAVIEERVAGLIKRRTAD